MGKGCIYVFFSLFCKKDLHNRKKSSIFAGFLWIVCKGEYKVSMKIALIGYGKMGHMLEQIALGRGHEVVCTLDVDTPSAVWDSSAFLGADVAIEFTAPAAAEQNIRRALQRGIPVVSGTTGWVIPDDLRAAQIAGKWVWKSNFSVGVNVFFELNRQLALLLKPYGYLPDIEEIHHIHKLDKPSGTAKTLQEDILSAGGQKVAVRSIREGEVPGTHTVTWDSPEDTIRIQHIAKGRQGFALGAVLEAEKLVNKRKNNG